MMTNGEKIIARREVQKAIQKGRLKKGKCFCGNPIVDAHHEDYSKPLKVVWLCRKHHAVRHLGEKNRYEVPDISEHEKLIEKVVERVDQNLDYNLSMILRDRLFPWTDDIRGIRSCINRDRRIDNVLESDITGNYRGTNYQIKGKNIIVFLAKYGVGLMFAKLLNKYKYDKEKTHKQKEGIEEGKKSKEKGSKESKKSKEKVSS